MEFLKDAADRLFSEDQLLAAAQAYEQILPLSHKKALLWANVAQCHLKLGDHKNAILASRNAVDIDPRWAKGHYRLGCALLLSGNHSAALKQLQNAQRLDPHDCFIAAKILEASVEVKVLISLDCCFFDVGRSLRFSRISSVARHPNLLKGTLV